MRLAGKVAIVTGAASGIGRTAAIMFAKEGAKLVISDVNDTNGKETESIICSSGGEAVFVHTDVSLASEVNSMIRAGISRFGKIDILFNNAGIGQEAVLVEDIEESTWDSIIAVNVKGMFLASKCVVPEMKKAGGGVIINTASSYGFKPGPRSSVYSASKGSVIALTKALAIELAEYNIRVNCISPDATDTPMLGGPQAEKNFASRKELVEDVAKTIPMGRVITTEDIAYGLIYLASDEAAMLTGVNLNIDGGRGI
ncbi:SDR family NAD(P)-dependent oxidoreductase [Chloroflexota bacterium]